MKLFGKIKQFSSDIKLIIVTALIMSSFMVYAAGECIISTTADDVTYNGSTVQAAIDELYARSHDYCPDGYECVKMPIIQATSLDDTTTFRSDTYREKIVSIILDDQINPPSNVIESWDIGIAQNGNVMAYITPNATSGYYNLYIQGDEGLYANPNSNYMFANLKGVESITGMDKLNTSLATKMKNMFYNTGYDSTNFTLDLGNNFDTSNVTDMSQMFSYTGYNSTVFKLDLKDKFDTSKSTTMHGMFYKTGYSSPVFTLDLGDKFNTSNVTKMRTMFQETGYSSTVLTLDLGDKFDTSKVTDMSLMFYKTGYNSEVFSLNLEDKFDTSNVIDMQTMFSHTGYRSSILTLDLGNKFDTSNVTNMAAMFDCLGYNNENFSLNLGDKFYTNNVTNMYYMFCATGSLNDNFTLDLSKMDFSSVIDYDGIFYGMKTSQKIYVKDATAQNWIITNSGNANLTTSNVLIKS